MIPLVTIEHVQHEDVTSEHFLIHQPHQYLRHRQELHSLEVDYIPGTENVFPTYHVDDDDDKDDEDDDDHGDSSTTSIITLDTIVLPS